MSDEMHARVVDCFAGAPATAHDLAEHMGIALTTAQEYIRGARPYLVVCGWQRTKGRPRTLWTLNPAPVGTWWQAA